MSFVFRAFAALVLLIAGLQTAAAQTHRQIMDSVSADRSYAAHAAAMDKMLASCKARPAPKDEAAAQSHAECLAACAETEVFLETPGAKLQGRSRPAILWRECEKAFASLEGRLAMIPQEEKRAADAAKAKAATEAAQAEKLAHDHTPLPESLSSVQPIAFSPAKTASLKDQFVGQAQRNPYLHEGCYAEAFDKVLAARYWTELEDAVRFINTEIDSGSPLGGFGPVTVDTAPALCRDSGFVAALNQGRGGGVGQMRKKICELAGPGGQENFAPSASSLSLRSGGTICVDKTALYKNEKQSCLSGASRMPGFGVHADAESFCDCSANRRSAAFDGGVRLDSESLTRSAVEARTWCQANL